MATLDEYRIDYDLVSKAEKTVIEKYNFIPLYIEEDYLYIAIGQENSSYLVEEFVKLYYNKKTAYIFFEAYVIEEKIKTIFKYTGELKDNKTGTEFTNPQNGETILAEILESSIVENATDIHFEPLGSYVRVRYRINGKLEIKPRIDFKTYDEILNIFKTKSKIDISESRRPQDGRMEISLLDRDIDLRISTIPLIYGEKLVVRILDKSNFNFKLDSLGLEEEEYLRINQLIREPYGMILITGPAGSGKTTTLYTIIQELNSVDSNIISIEDPIEYQIEGINQSQINKKIGYDFNQALHGILRQDPNIIMLGEIREESVAKLSFRAAVSGHLILSTLHTNNGPGTILRLDSLAVNKNIIASGLRAVISQRLVRRLCPSCKLGYRPLEYEKTYLSLEGEDLLFKANKFGCNECRLGYAGMQPLVEIMEMDNNMKAVVENNLDYNSLQTAMEESGFVSLDRKIRKKIIDGEISFKDGTALMSQIG